MYYCDKCHLVSETESCDCCSNTKLRDVREDDCCFLIECEEVFGKMFGEILQNEAIDCVMEPVGNGVRSNFGLSLGKYKIFVPNRFYLRAQELLEYFRDHASSNDRLKNDLLDNIQKWSFEKRSTEKKIRKKYKIDKELDVMDFVKNVVENACLIEDVGLMSYGEHGLLVKCDGVTLWFSSESYKISI